MARPAYSGYGTLSPCRGPPFGGVVREQIQQVSGLEALRQSVITTDRFGVVTFWNEAAARLLGWSTAEAVGRELSALVELSPPVADLIERLVVEEDWSGEFAVRRRHGPPFLARVDHAPLRDAAGEMTGLLTVVTDVTEQVWDRHRTIERLRRLDAALDGSDVGCFTFDTLTGLAVWDHRMERLFGWTPGTFPGDRGSWESRIVPEDRDWVLAASQAAVDGGTRIDNVYRVQRPDGEVVWLHSVGSVLRGPDGRAVGITGTTVDVTERRRVEDERAAFLASERARRDRFAFLAEASAAFVESLDDQQVLNAVAGLVVPRLADWYALDLIVDGDVRTVSLAHTDPEEQELLTALQRPTAVVGALPGVAAVIAEGGSRLYAEFDSTTLALASDDPQQARVLRGVGIRSAMIVPLTARGRTFGALSLVLAGSDLTYSDDDLALAEDLARRAALAIDNARLFADRSHVARVLQQSLLPPELPDVPGVEVAARYRAAEEGSEIGGDFYDLFETARGDWAIALGDVSGKGTGAAVLTGLARHTLRAAAVREARPIDVLAALNHAVHAQDHGERFLTIVYAHMALTDYGAGLTVCSAGHPPPLVLRADGRVDTVEEVGGLIGLFEEADLVETKVELGPGDAVILYTDGVLEARREGQFYGEERLLELIRSCAGFPARRIAERIEDTVIEFQAGRPRDDIAIMIVRIPLAAPPAPPLQEVNP